MRLRCLHSLTLAPVLVMESMYLLFASQSALLVDPEKADVVMPEICAAFSLVSLL